MEHYQFKRVDEFKYLGSLIKQDNKMSEETDTNQRLQQMMLVLTETKTAQRLKYTYCQIKVSHFNSGKV